MVYMCVDTAQACGCKTRTCFFKSEARAANSFCFMNIWHLPGPYLVSQLAYVAKIRINKLCTNNMHQQYLWQFINTVLNTEWICPKHGNMPGTTPTENTRKRPFVEAYAEAISDGVWGPRKQTSLEKSINPQPRSFYMRHVPLQFEKLLIQFDWWWHFPAFLPSKKPCPC